MTLARLPLHRIARGLLLTAALAASACAGDESTEAAAASPSTTLIGRIGTDKTQVALVFDDTGKAFAYSCDGTSFGERFDGSLAGGKGTLSSADGDTLAINLDGSGASATGNVTVHGKPFAVNLTKAADEAGLYWNAEEIDGEVVVAGWIVNEDGSETGWVAGNGAGEDDDGAGENEDDDEAVAPTAAAAAGNGIADQGNNGTLPNKEGNPTGGGIGTPTTGAFTDANEILGQLEQLKAKREVVTAPPAEPGGSPGLDSRLPIIEKA